MTLFYFLRGLMLRATRPVRQFVVETVRLGDATPVLTFKQLADLRARNEAAILAKARPSVSDKTNHKTGRGPRPGDTIIVVDSPLLRGDVL